MKQRMLQTCWMKRRTPRGAGRACRGQRGRLWVVAFLHKAPTVPTFQVKRGEFLDVLEFRGQLKAMKSVSITAPANAGDLQILKIAADGTQVKKGDVVVEFDPSKTQQDLAQDQSAAEVFAGGD